MIVYRFERNGLGPFTNPIRSRTIFRPTPQTRTQKKSSVILNQALLSSNVDRSEAWVKAHKSKEYMFGCTSKELLRAYFGGQFKEFFRQGYRIKRYKVPDDEVIDMIVEVAFPVKYHKLQTVKAIQKKLTYTS